MFEESEKALDRRRLYLGNMNLANCFSNRPHSGLAYHIHLFEILNMNLRERKVTSHLDPRWEYFPRISGFTKTGLRRVGYIYRYHNYTWHNHKLKRSTNPNKQNALFPLFSHISLPYTPYAFALMHVELKTEERVLLCADKLARDNRIIAKTETALNTRSQEISNSGFNFLIKLHSSIDTSGL